MTEDSQASPYRFLTVLLRNWRSLIAIPVAATVATIAVSLLRAPTYTASASFVPQAEGGAQSQFSSLAARFGVDLGSPAGIRQTPTFYRTLLRTDEIAQRVTTEPFRMGDDGSIRSQPLWQLLEIDEKDTARRMRETVRAVHEMTEVSVERETGVVTISVRSPWPSVSLEMITRMLALVNAFNLQKRQEQAAAERAFIQGRLDAAAAELRAAEDELQQFLTRNRQYQGDPQLRFEYERRQRVVDMRQAVYSTLAQGYEQASLNAQRDTPLTMTVQPPKVDPRADSRHIALGAAMAFLLGAVAALVFSVLREFFTKARNKFPTDYVEFTAMRTRVAREMSVAKRR